jgi:dipeptidyl-peptidase 4
MKTLYFDGLVRATLTALALGVSVTTYGQSSHDAFSINALYAIPSPIGTEPGGAAFSADGERIAFLWNDQGGTFRDVWLFDKASGEKQRLTDHGEDTDVALEHRGIGEVLWIGPGSQHLAYTLDGQLYVSDTQGNTRSTGAGLTAVGQLAASPNGKHLTLVANRVGNDQHNPSAVIQALWLIENVQQAGSSAGLLLDPGHPDSQVKSYSWGAQGRQISFELRHMGDMAKRNIHYYQQGKLQIDTVKRAFPGEPNLRFDVGVVNVQTGRTRLLERQDDTYPVWNYGLSARGSKLFINESDPYVKLHRIEMYNLTDGKRHTFYQERDSRHLRPDWRAAWAPGDDGLIILTDKDGFLHLYHQKTANTEPLQLTSGEWEISDFAVANDTMAVYFRANLSHVAERQLYRVSLPSGAISLVSGDNPGTHHVVYAPDMRSAASLFSNDQTPPDLYLIDFETKKQRRVTTSRFPTDLQQGWADVRYVEFSSHLDKTPLIGRLSVPPDYDPAKRYPLIVGSVYSDSVRNQWGGRTAHPTWGLDQHLIAQGYILLNVNVRGSWGQGREHNQGLLHSYGIIDIDDLHSGVLHLIESGYADPQRVGIWGSSYGGLMTMMSLFKKPEVYAAGIAGAPATNVAHAYPEQMWVMGPASGADMPGRYEKQSALYHTQGLQDPLMIIHGSRDSVVLYSDTIAVANQLIAGEQPFELVTLPGVGHGWDNEMSDVRRFAFKKMVTFFNRHLQGVKD